MKTTMWSGSVLIIFEILLFSAFTESITQKLFFNSYTACGQIFQVSYNREYVIKPDASPETKTHSFRDCELTFHAAEKGRKICLMQTGNVGMIADPNVQLEATDGLGESGDKRIELLRYGTIPWKVREYCSETEYITLYLSEIQKTQQSNIRKVMIEFRIVEIESPSRSLYLTGRYCNNDFKLYNSAITLSNRPQFPGMLVTPLTSECGIGFERINGQRNTSICFAYVPSENRRCDSSWRFAVSFSDFDLDEEKILYSLKCNETKANELHVWCAQPSISYLTIILWRNRNILSNSSIEPSESFKYYVMDYKGTQESLLQTMEAKFDKSSEASFLKDWMIYAIGGVALVFLIAVMAICCKRRKSYKPVNRSIEIEETSPKMV